MVDLDVDLDAEDVVVGLVTTRLYEVVPRVADVEPLVEVPLVALLDVVPRVAVDDVERLIVVGLTYDVDEPRVPTVELSDVLEDVPVRVDATVAPGT